MRFVFISLIVFYISSLCSPAHAYAQTSLQSSFFSQDATAQQIANGQITNMLITTSFHKSDGSLDVTKFQYKIFNALRMLGYAHWDRSTSQPVIDWARHFMRTHNIAESDVITSSFIRRLDTAIYAHEQEISQIANTFPVNESFDYNGIHYTYIPHSSNEPTKDHIRYYMTAQLKQLPQFLVPFTLKSTVEFLQNQGHGMIFFDSTDQKWKLSFFPSTAPLNMRNKGIYTQEMSDVRNATTFIHEYAHQTDGTFYTNMSPTSGMVNTSTYYSMMFDMNSCVQEVGWTYCKVKPGAKFMTEYSLGWTPPSNRTEYHSIYEVYAEAFSIYVLQGNLFRHLASLDTSYREQYQWLKSNAFQNIEYCTGSTQLMSWDSPSWDYANGLAPSGVSDLEDAYIELTTSINQPILKITDVIKKCAGATLSITPTSANTFLALSLALHGIGKGGDNVNPTAIGTSNPARPQRQVFLELSDTANNPSPIKQGMVSFDNAAGVFKGVVDMGTIAAGVYTMKLHMPHYLRKTIPGILSITNGQITTIPQVALVTGDSNNDNKLSILDYNMILDCFSDLSPAKNCADANKKLATDLTDDSNVNQFDYNLFLRELSVQGGQ